MGCQHQFSDRNQYDEQKVTKPTAQENKDERSIDQGDHRVITMCRVPVYYQWTDEEQV